MTRFLKPLLVSALLVFLAAPPALAENPTVNVQVFRPSAHHDDLFTVMNTNIGRHMRWSASMMFSFGKNPLVFVEEVGDDSVRHEVIQDQLSLDLMGSLSLFERLSIGLAVPVFLLNSGDGGDFVSPEPASAALGDVRLSPKVGILMRGEDEDGFGLGAELLLNLPTGDGDSFVSDGFHAQPTVIADFRSGPVLVALNVGFRIRAGDETLPFETDVSHELVWRVGGRYDVLPKGELQVIGEVYGASADWSEANNTHIEGVVGGRYQLQDIPLSFTVGGGSGFTKGYGNTKFRIFAGAKYSPQVIIDHDQDGILDDVDKCMMAPEDFDGFEDQDGCPDTDNDKDGVVDSSDKCPNDAEDKDGFQDEDGCPDPDNDGDGVADATDKCVDTPEDKDGFEDDDGCPDTDNDKDGIPDVDDQCRDEPETRNGHLDEDGCPDETLAKVEKGKIVILQKIFFDLNRATIKEESFPVLKAVSGILKANPEIKSVRIEGHTDDQGGANYNRRLSQKRAESVVQWLVADGIGAERMQAIGHGEDKPAMEGKTKEAREKNRRVEFHIVETPE